MEENNNEKISVSGADLLKDVVADEKAAKTAPKDTEKDKKDKDKKKDKKEKKTKDGKKFNAKKLKHGTMATVFTCVFVALLVLVNVVVPPHDIDGRVTGHQLPDLGVQVFLVGGVVAGNVFPVKHGRLPRRVAEIRADGVVIRRVVPVNDGVVEAHFQAAPAAGVHIFANDVPVHGAFGVVIRQGAVKQAEAFMVLAGEHYILTPRIPGELGPFFRQSFPGLEQGQGFRGVGVRIHFHVFLNPFGTSGPAFPFPGQSGIQAVVDEHAEFGVPPPFHAPVTFLRRFSDCGMVGIRGEGESGRGCRKFRGNGGRGVLLCSTAAQPGRELFHVIIKKQLGT